MTDDLYTRQHELDIEVPHTVTIIGVGGVGSWTALNMALAGAQKIFLVDPDHVERHNLNRTPFKESHEGMDKVTAVSELITERRMNAEPVPVPDRVEDVAGSIRDDIADNPIIDCRDHASPLPNDLSENVAVTVGYDGFEFTLHTNPEYDHVWGEENTEYETVPSFVAPAQFTASLVTAVACSPELQSGEEHHVTQNMKDLIQDLFTAGDAE